MGPNKNGLALTQVMAGFLLNGHRIQTLIFWKRFQENGVRKNRQIFPSGANQLKFFCVIPPDFGGGERALATTQNSHSATLQQYHTNPTQVKPNHSLSCPLAKQPFPLLWRRRNRGTASGKETYPTLHSRRFDEIPTLIAASVTREKNKHHLNTQWVKKKRFGEIPILFVILAV